MKKLYEMFNEIALPFYEGKGVEGSKEHKFLELLSKYGAFYEDKVGLIVPSVTEVPSKVIVSHMDLVRPFQNGFSMPERQTFKVGEKWLTGALDNTLTNAFLILAILELREQGLAQDVEFLFTEGEETGMTGMRHYMLKCFRGKENAFFVNLDVTNDNWDYAGSVEFDYPCYHMCKQIEQALPGINGFTHQRFADDTGVILSGGGNAFSYCIPTQNYCHTYQSRTSIDKLEPYYKGLLFMITELDGSDYIYDLQNGLNNHLLSGLIQGESHAFEQ